MKIKNMNCGYAYVRGMVFCSVAEGLAYCKANELDPNAWLEADSPEAFEKCQQTVKAALPLLEAAKNEITAFTDIQREKMQLRVKMRDEAEVTHSLDYGYLQNQVQEQSGILQGLFDARDVLDRRIKAYRKLAGKKFDMNYYMKTH